jgi:HEAT repeat protein
MRGDDLGAVLLGVDPSGARFAFASVAELNMVTDGRLKVVCGASDVPCHAFDLERDPGETRNVAMTQPADVARLRGQLQRFLGSIADGEALAVDKGIGFPPALARARLGAPGAGAALTPLLGDVRPPVRCEAARALGELGMAAALPMLRRLAEGDASSDVRAEAAVAVLRLARDEGATDAALRVLARAQQGAQDLDLARRAALALADVKRAEAAPVLVALAADDAAEERMRLRAIEALGMIGRPSEVRALVALLSEPRLRVAVCQALARLGDPQAADAIAEQLARERYQPARQAEAEALLALGDPRALTLTYEMLGRETSMPGGVRLLLDHDARGSAQAAGGWLSNARLRRGSWRCRERSCRPGAGARLVLRVQPDGESRVTVLVRSDGPDGSLSFGERQFALAAGEQQLSLALPPSRHLVPLPVNATGDVTLLAVVVVPAVEEIPLPAPEPWDAGR